MAFFFQYHHWSLPRPGGSGPLMNQQTKQQSECNIRSGVPGMKGMCRHPNPGTIQILQDMQ